MKLTKLQRHTAYIVMLEEIGLLGGPYKSKLCHIIYKFFGINNDGFDDKWDGDWFWDSEGSVSINKVLDFFPELSKKQPDTGWPPNSAKGVERRKEWLKQCIQETAL